MSDTFAYSKKDIMKKSAENLGVVIGELFKIIEFGDKVYFKISEAGVYSKNEGESDFINRSSVIIVGLLCGELTLVEILPKIFYGQEYFYIDEYGACKKATNYNDITDLALINMGNYFISREKAEINKDKILNKINEIKGRV